MRKILTALLCSIVFVAGINYRAIADYAATAGNGLLFRAFDATHGGTILCAAASTQCQGVVLIDSAGAEKATSGNPVSVSAIGLAQGSTTAAQTGTLDMGAVTTSAPSYSNAQTSPISLTTAGAVRQDISSINGAAPDPCQGNAATIKSFSITSNTTTNIVTGTAAKKLYVCYLYMQTAAANNVAVISGTTGATCGANTAALIGGTTAANGLNNAANSGQALGNGGYAVLQVQTANDDICIITSASTPLAGVIKTVVQ